MKRKKTASKIIFPISIQISIFLVIIAFVPIAAIMAFKTYEKQLLEQTENSNIQQARLVASFLGQQELSQSQSITILKNMNGRFDARIRIIDKNKNLLADSATLNFSENAPIFPENSQYQLSDLQKEQISPEKKSPADERFIYRLLSKPIRIYRKYFKPPVLNSYDYYTIHSIFDGKEIQTALEGRYGATTRISGGGQVSVTLYSAVPIFKNGDFTQEILGVVLVNRSTYKILQNLYELRLDLGKIFLWSLLVVLLIAIFLSIRISHPIKKLATQTVTCADKKGRVINNSFIGKNRKDEIGELSRSFESLVERLNSRIKFTESFASDVSHEFKNPLAAIRSCTELLSDPSLTKQEREEFTNAITEEVYHLENLLTGVRNITKIDGNTEIEKEEINLSELTKNLINRIKLAFPSLEIHFTDFRENPSELILINESYYNRILDNLLSNAASFATKVSVTLSTNKNKMILSVEDNGKGISPEEQSKIFERFYSNRTDDFSKEHSGLGLSTVKAICEALDGNVTVKNGTQLGGALFTVTWNYK